MDKALIPRLLLGLLSCSSYWLTKESMYSISLNFEYYPSVRPFVRSFVRSYICLLVCLLIHWFILILVLNGFWDENVRSVFSQYIMKYPDSEELKFNWHKIFTIETFQSNVMNVCNFVTKYCYDVIVLTQSLLGKRKH